MLAKRSERFNVCYQTNKQSNNKEIMTTERIKEIQSKTAYPDSISVQQALLQVWNECEQLNKQSNNK